MLYPEIAYDLLAMQQLLLECYVVAHQFSLSPGR